MAGMFTQFTLKHFEIRDWVLFSSQIKIVPELTNFLIQETDVASAYASC